MVAGKNIKKHLKNEWGYHLMLLPGVILVFIFSYIPLYGVVIAFQDYNPALGFASPWVGLKNFMFVFSQPDFVRTIWNTFYITAFKILGNIAVPVIFALLLNEVKNVFFKRTMQTLIYIPNFISWVIMAGILMDILATDGAVNRCINLLGGGTVNFLGSAKIYPWTMIISDIWKSFGYGTIIYLAALTGIDQIYNTISPIVYSSGDIIDTYVYRLGIQQAQFDVGAAVGLFKSAVSSVLVVLSYVLADKLAGYRIL